MKKKGLLNNIIVIVISNMIVLSGKIVSGFIIPKVLGIQGYAQYKTFILYLTYCALLHFGFVDGILLKLAGEEYSRLETGRMRLYTKFLMLMQAAIAGVFITAALLLCHDVYRLIFILLGIDAAVINITTYFQFISQCTMRFKELSTRNILRTLFRIMLVVIMLLDSVIEKKSVNACIYIMGIVVIDTILMLWYVYTYRNITFGQSLSFRECIGDISCLFKTGVVLSISCQVSILMFSLDQQFVLIAFDEFTYGIYSFAYTLISMVTTVINAVSVVLLPMLRQKREEDMLNDFEYNMSVISIVVFAALLGYYPLGLVVQGLLPAYSSAMRYVEVIFPGLAISCCINIIMFTYYKALNQQMKYLKCSVWALILSTVLNMVGAWWMKSPLAVSYFSIITHLVWYLLCERLFVINYQIKWKKNFVYLISLMLSFYVVNTVVQQVWLACGIYLMVYLAVTYTFFREILSDILNRIKSRFTGVG